jgi:hypothetical protein
VLLGIAAIAALLFAAFGPRATITIAKLAGSFVPQALSARIFGFHPWSLALPQVIEGVISVLAMYRAVRRWAGVMPGLLADQRPGLGDVRAGPVHGRWDGYNHQRREGQPHRWPGPCT